MNRIISTMKYHFKETFEMVRYNVCLGNSQTTDLKNFRSYPVKTHYIH